MAAVHSLRFRSSAGSLPLTETNVRWLVVLAALLPVQFVLLRFGAPHATTDEIGVLLTIAQWFLLGAALRRVRPRRALA
ncbi:MAG: hypothetical protein ABR517_00445 [Thermoanaerobaculia bacterium]